MSPLAPALAFLSHIVVTAPTRRGDVMKAPNSCEIKGTQPMLLLSRSQDTLRSAFRTAQFSPIAKKQLRRGVRSRTKLAL